MVLRNGGGGEGERWRLSRGGGSWVVREGGGEGER